MRIFLLLLTLGCAALRAQAERVALVSGAATCVVDTEDGARIVSWKTDGEERLWMPSERAAADGRWRHGGLPLCWPWICDDWPAGAPRSPHGLAWCGAFAVRARRPDAVTLSFVADGLALEYTIALSDRLELTLRTTNQTAVPKPYQLSLHPYLRVAVDARTQIVGLDGLSYRDTRAGHETNGVWRGTAFLNDTFDHEFHRRAAPLEIRVRESDGRGFDIATPTGGMVVVWNPGAAWTTDGEKLYGGLPVGAWRRFLSVEPSEEKRTLAPGETRVFSAHFRPRP